MNDRELIVNAARAAGYNTELRENGTEFAIERDGRWHPFDPLTDDGDALRLAVKLEIDIWYSDDSVEAAYKIMEDGFPGGRTYSVWEQAPDKFDATRRAIVRAAAAIAKLQSSAA